MNLWNFKIFIILKSYSRVMVSYLGFLPEDTHLQDFVDEKI